MKTIAITIAEDTVDRVDKLVNQQESSWGSRSEFVRQALRDYLAGLEKRHQEEKEREIFRRYRQRLNRQAAALIQEQARQ